MVLNAHSTRPKSAKCVICCFLAKTKQTKPKKTQKCLCCMLNPRRINSWFEHGFRSSSPFPSAVQSLSDPGSKKWERRGEIFPGPMFLSKIRISRGQAALLTGLFQVLTLACLPLDPSSPLLAFSSHSSHPLSADNVRAAAGVSLGKRSGSSSVPGSQSCRGDPSCIRILHGRTT